MSAPRRRTKEEFDAAADGLGRELITEIMLRYGDVLDGADKQHLSRLIGGLGVCALLYAASGCDLNKIWMLEGVGVAIGETQAAQDEATASLILEAFERGRDLGFGSELAVPPGDPRRMRVALEAIAAGDGCACGQAREYKDFARRALGLEPLA